MTKISVQALIDKHEALIDRLRQGNDPTELVPEMDGFLQELREAGRDIPLGDERDLVRTLATYWAGNIYEHSPSGTYPNAELEPYTGPPVEEPRRGAEAPTRRRWTWILVAIPLLLVGLAVLAIVLRVPLSAQATPTLETNTAVAQSLTRTAAAMIIETSTPTATSSLEPPPSETSLPELQTPTAQPGVSVLLDSPANGEEIFPETILAGTYSNLEPGWTIHTLLQPISLAGRLFPAADSYTVPEGVRTGAWGLDPAFYASPTLAQGEQYTIHQVVALDENARRALEARVESGFENLAELPATALVMPSPTTAFLGAYEAIDEDRLVYGWFAEGEGIEIFTSRPDGTEIRQLTFTLNQSEFDPNLSPDGRKIVYVGRTRDDIYSLQVMDSSGRGAETLLTEAGVIYDGPVWSPDGRFIAYGATIFAPDGGFLERVIFLYDTVTDEREPLTEGYPTLFHPTWFPDGDTLLAEGAVPATASVGLYRIDLDTGKVSVFYDTEAQEGQPSVSPNGQQVAYVQFPDFSRGSIFDIYVLDLATQEPRRLTNHDGMDQWPAWHPDGQSVYFETRRFDAIIPEIWAIDIDGKNARPITSGPGYGNGPHNLGVMRSLLFAGR